MTDDRSQPDSMAAEYALGLLTGDELRAAVDRVASEPAFAAEVARWRGRLAPLHSETEAVTPPAGLWDGIEHAIWGGDAANDNAPELRRRIMIWKSTAGAMTAIAVSLALVLAFEPRSRFAPVEHHQPLAASSPMVAMLGDQGSMKVVASWDPTERQLVLAIPGDMSTDPQHSHELWVIPTGGKPKSLGTMPSSKQMHMRLADALATLLQQGATIAISVEPRGGSPTGSPTGPVVAAGALTRA